MVNFNCSVNNSPVMTSRQKDDNERWGQKESIFGVSLLNIIVMVTMVAMGVTRGNYLFRTIMVLPLEISIKDFS